MTARIERLGHTLVRGTAWRSLPAAEVGDHGIASDRRWTPVRPDLTCPRATDHPHLVRVDLGPDDLPGAAEALHRGDELPIAYYDRTLAARVYGGPAAERLSDALGEPVHLAHTTGSHGFIWSEPVSVLLRSELGGLPGDVDRYRANVVVDDIADPLRLAVGDHLALGRWSWRSPRSSRGVW